MKLLIVEDNRDIHDNLVDFFELRGHVVEGARDGLTGLHLAETGCFDAIILDIMLPGIDGNEICHLLRMRSRSPAAIIMLTARDELDDRLMGFKAGADDYVVKPFAMAEILARLEAILFRRTGHNGRKLKLLDLELDLDTLEVHRGNTPINLSSANLKILELLMRSSPAIVKRKTLEELLWGSNWHNRKVDSIRNHIHQIRQVVDKPFAEKLLHTVRGDGYKICSPAP
ncbi:DNA-binding response OmpR family regulator [Pseudomonas hunanensis]|uniref:DNA-binding response OmpR family regulator n=1 Tax=Pseudomonas hunanensis TaxID=1247546 RepID=A0ACC6K7L2_9PSED|nr:response regulator transcription factor [Pseudomonas hunanensis]MDR6714432.1 DNA-binding response OmpR family regulator [Pseudomonas hunanensis]